MTSSRASPNEETFRRFVEQYQRAVFGRCYRLLGDQDEAADATQEVFLRVYRAWDRFDPQRPLLPWLMTIATRLCIDRLRRRKPPAQAWDDARGAGDVSGLEARVLDAEDARALRRLVHQLQEPDRTLIILHYWEGLSYEEMAQQTGLTVSAIKSRLYRARRWLAQAWERRQGGR